MANENKNEKAGATTPATPSTVEGTQSTSDKARLDLISGINKLAEELGLSDEPNKLKSLSDAIIKLHDEQAAKGAEIEALKAEHQDFKDKLKPEIEKIKAENEKLKAELAKAGKSTKASKAGAAKFVVVSAFRGTQKDEGIFEIDADVSHFDADRLKDLVERELVKEVK